MRILSIFFHFYFCIQGFSLKIALIILKLYKFVDNINLEGTVSQNVDVGASYFFYLKKREDFLFFFHDYFSRFHQIKTRTYIQNLRHSSLHLNVLYRHVKFYDWKIINDGDILVQKIKVKNNFSVSRLSHFTACVPICI